MVAPEPTSPTTPLFSVIIGVYNDWVLLNLCLRSLAEQTNAPTFEVVVVDDGSVEPPPESIGQWRRHFPLTILSQSHAGIPSARNRGIQNSSGSLLLFIDADSRTQEDCLAALGAAIANAPRHNCFQLRLVGDGSTLVGRAEDLRLRTFQNHMLQSDGRIRYLNTAGFAIRRNRVNIDAGLFDPLALRAEDTLLLASLIQSDELPLFVPSATVQHLIPMSLLGCFLKDIRSAYLEGRTYDVIRSMGVRVRVTHRERLTVLRSMWKTAGESSVGRAAWFVLVARQALQRIVSFACRWLRIRPKPQTPDSKCDRPA